jgi:hypothetical protein
MNLLLSRNTNLFQFQTGINYYASISKHMSWPPLWITFPNQEFKIKMYTTLSWSNYY